MTRLHGSATGALVLDGVRWTMYGCVRRGRGNLPDGERWQSGARVLALTIADDQYGLAGGFRAGMAIGARETEETKGCLF